MQKSVLVEAYKLIEDRTSFVRSLYDLLVATGLEVTYIGPQYPRERTGLDFSWVEKDPSCEISALHVATKFGLGISLDPKGMEGEDLIIDQVEKIYPGCYRTIIDSGGNTILFGFPENLRRLKDLALKMTRELKYSLVTSNCFEDGPDYMEKTRKERVIKIRDEAGGDPILFYGLHFCIVETARYGSGRELIEYMKKYYESDYFFEPSIYFEDDQYIMLVNEALEANMVEIHTQRLRPWQGR